MCFLFPYFVTVDLRTMQNLVPTFLTQWSDIHPLGENTAPGDLNNTFLVEQQKRKSIGLINLTGYHAEVSHEDCLYSYHYYWHLVHYTMKNQYLRSISLHDEHTNFRQQRQKLTCSLSRSLSSLSENIISILFLLPFPTTCIFVISSACNIFCIISTNSWGSSEAKLKKGQSTENNVAILYN